MIDHLPGQLDIEDAIRASEAKPQVDAKLGVLIDDREYWRRQVRPACEQYIRDLISENLRREFGVLRLID